MYRPKAYVQDDIAALHALIGKRSFALIATVIEGRPEFAYAPVVLGAQGSKGSARFHLALANPLSHLDGAAVRLSFLGPDAYVSPDWYVTEGLVPTWNYAAVEASGVARRLERSALLQLLADLSAQEEERLKPKKPWTLDKVPEARLEALVNAIVGFSVEFETLEGKLKLSQDKKPEDFDGVVRALETKGGASLEVAKAMRDVAQKRSL